MRRIRSCSKAAIDGARARMEKKMSQTLFPKPRFQNAVAENIVWRLAFDLIFKALYICC
ncbi:unnamed protein product [Brassica oleracea var. botrytis]|uniref:(rape) hypothetical protein n=1 Tax=Brassica napus TaxID=3708 RepID=A0A816KN46_BRANA|nr:unnamed protein product [Brassica napus]